jgi:hypothetical protein
MGWRIVRCANSRLEAGEKRPGFSVQVSGGEVRYVGLERCFIVDIFLPGARTLGADDKK